MVLMRGYENGSKPFPWQVHPSNLYRDEVSM